MSAPAWAADLTPSPAAGLRLDITALRRTPGNQRSLQMIVEEFDGVALPSIDVESTQIDIDLVLEVVGDQLIAVGELGATWTGPCRRCLEPMTDRVSLEVREVFEKAPVEGETYPLEDEFVDLRPMVREALVLSLPVAPLCGEDCRGPAPDAFPASTVEDAPTDVEQDAPADPRWAALDALSFEEESSDDESFEESDAAET